MPLFQSLIHYHCAFFCWHTHCCTLVRNKIFLIMKKSFLYIFGGIFLLTAFAYAADNSAPESIKTGTVKTISVKAAKMNARGKVIEISDEAITIERTVRGNVEKIKFELDKPAENIAVNDSVSIAYTEQDGKLMASRVSKTAQKTKEIKPVAEKSTPGKK